MPLRHFDTPLFRRCRQMLPDEMIFRHFEFIFFCLRCFRCCCHAAPDDVVMRAVTLPRQRTCYARLSAFVDDALPMPRFERCFDATFMR